AAGGGPGARHLPRPPAAGARRRTSDVQAAVRPPWREPSGRAARERPRARDQPEPRLRGRALRGARSDTRLALRRDRRRARLPARARALGSVPSGGGAGAPRPVAFALEVG